MRPEGLVGTVEMLHVVTLGAEKTYLHAVYDPVIGMVAKSVSELPKLVFAWHRQSHRKHDAAQ
ncbi:hypothetical protein GCM10007105_02480 [Shewanella chilikensis]|nr:hypothetical protein GCM10007105_02480 [Shewanella chilikensis]